MPTAVRRKFNKELFDLINVDNGIDKKDAMAAYADMFRLGRCAETGEDFSYRDAMAVPHASEFMPKVITDIGREAVEPQLMLTPLFDEIEWRNGLEIVYGATGALIAKDMSEGEEYPEQQLQIGGATATATVGKSGVAFKVTEEMRQNATVDVIGMHARASGRAMARHKETKAAKFIQAIGFTVFDNLNPTASQKGVLTGRDFKGAANGSLNHEDLFELFGAVIANGFVPNLLIMHPLTWVMFMSDPILRTFAIQNGGGTWWGNYSGNPATRAPWNNPRTGQSTGQKITPSTPMSGYVQQGQMTSAPQFPEYMSPWPFQIVVSPYVFYNPELKITDIIVADRNEVGAHPVAERLFVDEWEDKSVDITKVKFRERYGFQVYHEGLGIATALNVKVAPNATVFPARATLDVSGLSTIPANTPILL